MITSTQKELITRLIQLTKDDKLTWNKYVHSIYLLTKNSFACECHDHTFVISMVTKFLEPTYFTFYFYKSTDDVTALNKAFSSISSYVHDGKESKLHELFDLIKSKVASPAVELKEGNKDKCYQEVIDALTN